MPNPTITMTAGGTDYVLLPVEEANPCDYAAALASTNVVQGYLEYMGRANGGTYEAWGPGETGSLGSGNLAGALVVLDTWLKANGYITPA
jgi:hypothetical protein